VAGLLTHTGVGSGHAGNVGTNHYVRGHVMYQVINNGAMSENGTAATSAPSPTPTQFFAP
jgi:hypothetical protein